MSHWTRLSRWQVYKQPPQRTFWLGQCSILTRLFSSENAPSDASKSVGKVVHLPGNPREPVRSELYGFKIYLHEGPCDQVNAGGNLSVQFRYFFLLTATFFAVGGVAGKTGTKWVHPMRDAQPQKFVNVDGQTHILGVNTPPIDEAHWDATRNTTWNKVSSNYTNCFSDVKRMLPFHILIHSL